MPDPKESLFLQFRRGLRAGGFSNPNTKKARAWFIEKVRDLSGTINRRALLNDSELSRVTGPKIGEMYMYVYDPKLKDSLPYYDRFPLIIMVGPADGGFYGLNLHYLNPIIRAAFLDKLVEATGTGHGETARLRITYELLKKARRFKEFAPCFKHYLTDHVRTKISKVAGTEWPIAIFLPTEHFAKATKQKVWRDSAKQIHG